MDFSKVQVLQAIRYLNDRGAEWVSVRRDADKPKDIFEPKGAYALRLRWFGLVDAEHPDAHKNHGYRINSYGRAFLAGAEPVPEVIWARQGEIVAVADARVYVHQCSPVRFGIDYWDTYWTRQRPHGTSPLEDSSFLDIVSSIEEHKQHG